MHAVMWTDLIQFTVKIGGALLAAGVILAWGPRWLGGGGPGRRRKPWQAHLANTTANLQEALYL